MKNIISALCLTMLGFQAAAATLAAGINFQEIANQLNAYQGAYLTNATGVPTGASVDTPSAIVDGNAASYVMSGTYPSTLDLGFGTTLDAANRDLTILLVGNDAPHDLGVSLLNGTSVLGSDTFGINSVTDNTLGYTGYNMVMNPNPGSEASLSPVTWGIYALNIHLADHFSGSFDGVRLDISGYSAAPSLVGTVSVVPVPAAVWLFGSGLLGLVGLVRKRA